MAIYHRAGFCLPIGGPPAEAAAIREIALAAELP
jgi:hypothetical protein